MDRLLIIHQTSRSAFACPGRRAVAGRKELPFSAFAGPRLGLPRARPDDRMSDLGRHFIQAGGLRHMNVSELLDISAGPS